LTIRSGDFSGVSETFSEANVTNGPMLFHQH
jgi:hypothetical protein